MGPTLSSVEVHPRANHESDIFSLSHGLLLGAATSTKVLHKTRAGQHGALIDVQNRRSLSTECEAP